QFRPDLSPYASHSVCVRPTAFLTDMSQCGRPREPGIGGRGAWPGLASGGRQGGPRALAGGVGGRDWLPGRQRGGRALAGGMGGAAERKRLDFVVTLDRPPRLPSCSRLANKHPIARAPRWRISMPTQKLVTPSETIDNTRGDWLW